MITKKPLLTRKNLIVLALSFFYSFLFVFVGLCIEATHSLISKKNIIQKLASSLGFKPIDINAAGFLTLLLVAVYVGVFVLSVLCIRRYLIENHKKPHSFKAILIYLLVFIGCAALSVGVGILLLNPLDFANIKNLLLFIGQTTAISTAIYLVIFILIGAATMLVVNFLLIDKPFRFFGNEEMNVLEEDKVREEIDVESSFDHEEEPSIASSFGPSVGGGVGGEADFGNVRKVEELDAKEKVFPALCTVDYHFEAYEAPKLVSDDLSLEEICERFRNYLAKEEKLYFDIDTIRVFISAFASSHFMILEGLSGTGKSSLPRYFCKFANGALLFVPVQATWRDKTNLLGYFNDFSKTYNETDFLTHMYKANYDKDRIHMFVLDEMNISRVEYYFADLLSVLEYPAPEWKLRLMQLPYDFQPPVKLENGVIQITENCYFVGTANKDDSTFSIADKVYDRAITIDFDYRNTPFTVEGDASPITLGASRLHQLYADAIANEENRMTEEDYEKFFKITEFVYDQFDITFGNRILNQIDTLVPTFIACGGTKEDVLDFLFSRKVLAKVEGRFEEYVKGALKKLSALLAKTYGAGVFKRSEKVINTLIRRL